MSDYSDYMSAYRAGNLESLNPKQKEAAAAMGIGGGASGSAGGSWQGNYEQLKGAMQPYINNAKQAYTDTLAKTQQMGSDFLNKYQQAYAPAFQDYMSKLGINQAMGQANRYGDMQALASRDAESFARNKGLTVSEMRAREADQASRINPLAQMAQQRLTTGLQALPALLSAQMKPFDTEQRFVEQNMTNAVNLLPKGAEVELNSLLSLAQQGVQMDENQKNRMQQLAIAEMQLEEERRQFDANNILAQQKLAIPQVLQTSGKNGFTYYTPQSGIASYQVPATPVAPVRSTAITGTNTSGLNKTTAQPYNQTTGEQNWQGSAGIGGKNYVYDLNELTKFGNPNDKLTNPYTGQKYNLQPGY